MPALVVLRQAVTFPSRDKRIWSSICSLEQAFAIMSSTFTEVSLHRLLQHLLAPAFADRLAADQMLFSLMSASGGEPNPELDDLLAAATDRFGDQEKAFLEDLLHFWMDAGAAAFAVRMKMFGGKEEGAWVPVPRKATFVMADESRFEGFTLFGLGIGSYLASQAHRLAAASGLLIRGLAHPEPVVADRCWVILGASAYDPPQSFPAMWALASGKGAYFAPDAPMRGLARIVEAYPPAIDVLVAALREDASDNAIEVACVTTQYLTVVPERLVAAISALHKRGHRKAYLLFSTLARVAESATAAQREAWLADAVMMSDSAEPDLRAAAVSAFVRLDVQRRHEAKLLALLDDEDWLPRFHACRMLAEWDAPKPDFVRGVARQLGNYDGYDGDPHDSALTTLIGWKRQSEPALAEIAKWLGNADASDVIVGRLMDLLDALGPAGCELLPQVERLIAALVDASDESDYDSEDETEEPSEAETTLDWSALVGHMADSGLIPAEASQLIVENDELKRDFEEIFVDEEEMPSPIDANAFAMRIGIDPNENIPGTLPSSEMSEAPDDLERLHRWRDGAIPV
jgi:hypothetical protein